MNACCYDKNEARNDVLAMEPNHSVKQPLIAIVGPTGVGKSAMGIALAKALQTEIISGDSIQVYRGLSIGSGKVTKDERLEVPHHLIDILSPWDRYSVKDFQTQAREIAANLHKQQKIPLIVGGTGLYIKSMLYDYQFDESSDGMDVDVSKYENRSNDSLFQELFVLDEEATKTIHPNNRKRLIRALTIYEQSGQTKSAWIAKQAKMPIYEGYLIGLTSERSLLYERINQRVDQMFADGLVEEVMHLVDAGIFFEMQCMQGIGYREFAPYVASLCSLDEVKRNIQTHSRQFAKRQYTWFQNQMDVHWYDKESTTIDQIITDVLDWMK